MKQSVVLLAGAVLASGTAMALATSTPAGPAVIDARYSVSGPTLRSLPSDPFGQVTPLLTASVPAGNWQVDAVADIIYKNGEDSSGNLECDLDNAGVVIARQQLGTAGLSWNQAVPVISVAKITTSSAVIDLRCWTTVANSATDYGLVIPYATRMIISKVGTITPAITP